MTKVIRRWPLKEPHAEISLHRKALSCKCRSKISIQLIQYLFSCNTFTESVGQRRTRLNAIADTSERRGCIPLWCNDNTVAKGYSQQLNSAERSLGSHTNQKWFLSQGWFTSISKREEITSRELARDVRRCLEIRLVNIL